MNTMIAGHCMHAHNGISLHTRQEATRLARQVTGSMRQEWLVVFYLGQHDKILGTYLSTHGLSCARFIDPDEYCDHGTALGARSFVTVRYHPHPWAYRPQALEAFCTWQKIATQRRMWLKDAIILDAQGKLFSFRGERNWEELQTIKAFDAL